VEDSCARNRLLWLAHCGSSLHFDVIIVAWHAFSCDPQHEKGGMGGFFRYPRDVTISTFLGNLSCNIYGSPRTGGG
jgi:hypothetical protein